MELRSRRHPESRERNYKIPSHASSVLKMTFAWPRSTLKQSGISSCKHDASTFSVGSRRNDVSRLSVHGLSKKMTCPPVGCSTSWVEGAWRAELWRNARSRPAFVDRTHHCREGGVFRSSPTDLRAHRVELEAMRRPMKDSLARTGIGRMQDPLWCAPHLNEAAGWSFPMRARVTQVVWSIPASPTRQCPIDRVVKSDRLSARHVRHCEREHLFVIGIAPLETVHERSKHKAIHRAHAKKQAAPLLCGHATFYARS